MSLQFTDLEEDPYMKKFSLNLYKIVNFYAMKNLGLTSEDADRFVSQIYI